MMCHNIIKRTFQCNYTFEVGYPLNLISVVTDKKNGIYQVASAGIIRDLVPKYSQSLVLLPT